MKIIFIFFFFVFSYAVDFINSKGFLYKQVFGGDACSAAKQYKRIYTIDGSLFVDGGFVSGFNLDCVSVNARYLSFNIYEYNFNCIKGYDKDIQQLFYPVNNDFCKEKAGYYYSAGDNAWYPTSMDTNSPICGSDRFNKLDICSDICKADSFVFNFNGQNYCIKADRFDLLSKVLNYDFSGCNISTLSGVETSTTSSYLAKVVCPGGSIAIPYTFSDVKISTFDFNSTPVSCSGDEEIVFTDDGKIYCEKVFDEENISDSNFTKITDNNYFSSVNSSFDDNFSSTNNTIRLGEEKFVGYFNIRKSVNDDNNINDDNFSETSNNLEKLIDLTPSDTSLFGSFSGLGDSIDNLVNSFNNVKNAISGNSVLNNFNENVVSCPIDFNLYKRSYKLDICSAISPYKSILSIFFTLTFSFSVLLYFVNIIFRSR